MSTQSFPELLLELKSAVHALNLAGAVGVAARMEQRVLHDIREVAELDVLAALKALRRKRLFQPLQNLAEAYFQHAQPAALRYQYAQALVDQDQVTSALCVSQQLLLEPNVPEDVAEEVRGLRGRAYKQAFVRAAEDADRTGRPLPFHAQDALRLSVRAYEEAYRTADNDPYWPAANLIALLTRARSDGIAVASAYDPVQLARKVLHEISALVPAAPAGGPEPSDNPWLLASALEASLAIRNDQQTIAWGQRYLACAAADAFELGASHRQLSEVWRLHREVPRPSAQLLALLEAELLRKRGGQLEEAPAARMLMDTGSVRQAVWGLERFKTYRWLDNALRCSDAVARVEDPFGSPKGTGFLVRGRELNAAWGAEPVFVTNRHVIDDPPHPNGIHPSRARIHFTTHGGEATYEVDKIIWRSPSGHPLLDVAVLQLRSWPTKGLGLAAGNLQDLRLGTDPPCRLYVIGHPQGDHVSYSLYDNDLLALETPFLYYRSPTLHGSSGSPLFDSDWRLLGIHHSRVDSREANCGSSLSGIRQAIQASSTP